MGDIRSQTPDGRMQGAVVTRAAPVGGACVAGRGQSIDDLFASRDYYAVLNAVLPIIGAAQGAGGSWSFGDAERIHAALLAVKSYVALGLIGPARELLTESYSPLAVVPEFEPLRLQLREMPSGRMQWAKLKERFERNAARLYERHPHLRELDAAFRSAAQSLELYWAADGNVHVSRPTTGGVRGWAPGLLDVSRFIGALRLPHDPKGLFCLPYVISGDHLGGLFRKVFDATAKMFMTFCPRIHLVEPDPAAIGLCLYLEEDIERWLHERVSIFAGPEATARFEAHLFYHPEMTAPDYCLRLPFAETNENGRLIEAIRRVVLANNERTRAAMERMNAHYDAIDIGTWAARYADGRPLRVLGITSRFTTVLQYSMRDVKAAFERLGHTFEILMEPTDFDLPTAAGSTEFIERCRPDMIFVIDHHRREYLQTMPKGVPFVGWVQDALPNLVCAEAGRSIGKLDFFISADPEELVRCYEYPQGHGLGWTFATNDRLYAADPVPVERSTAYRCDFSFVSNQSTVPEAFHREYVATNSSMRCPEVVYEYLFERLRGMSLVDGENAGSIVAGELIADLLRDVGFAPGSVAQRNFICRSYVHPLSELFFRQAALEWVADYCDQSDRTLHLYGSGWERHPRFARYARGVIENGEPLRGLYQSSAINLQIIGSGAVHPRLLDGLAAGGFFLVRAAAIDRVHEACRDILRFVDSGVLQAGRAYDTLSSPEVVAAIRSVGVLIGARASSGPMCLSDGDIAAVRSLYEQRKRRFAAAVFGSDFDRISFSSRRQFEEKANQYLSDSGARREAAASMRSTVVGRFTYDAMARDVLAFLRMGLSGRN